MTEAPLNLNFSCLSLIPLVIFSQVNLEYLESKLESVDGEDVQRIQDNINSLFHHCVQALGEEHQIKVVNALQVNTAPEDSLDFQLHASL